MSKEFKTGIVALVVLAMSFWGYSFLKGENIFQPNNRQFKVAVLKYCWLKQIKLGNY